MRIAILSDIHSNWEAFSEVLKKIEVLEAEKIVCLGDIVGYNADPDICVEEIFARIEDMVRGNHDKAVADLVNTDCFNEVARLAVRWTRKSLKQKSITRLKQLKQGPLLVDNKFLICHGSPMDEDLYILYESSVEASFQYIHTYYRDIKICFFGHTHIPAVIEENGKVYTPPPVFRPEEKRCYLINPGSVGQARDGIPLASFGLFNDEKGTYEHFRIPYPLEVTQKKILDAGLPRFLAERLAVGM